MGVELTEIKNHQKITSMPETQQEQQAARPISKKHLFVRDGMFKAELDEFFKRELAEDGYSGVIVRKSKTCEVIIIATRPSQVLGEKNQTHQGIDFHRQQTLVCRTRSNRSLRRTRCQPWSFCCFSSRISPIQTPRWSSSPPCRLRCPPFRYGKWRSRL